MSTRTKRLLLLLVIMAVGAGALSSAWLLQRLSQDRRAERLRESGLELYEAGQYEQAMSELSFVAGRPAGKSDVDVLYALADCRRRVPEENSRHLFSAQAFARAAHDADASDPRPLTLLLKLYERLGYAREMLDAAEDLLQLVPDDHEAHRVRIIALSMLGQDDEALQAAREMADYYSADPAVHGAVVQIMSNLGLDPSEQVDYVANLAERNPESAEFRLLHMQVAARYGMNDVVESLSETLPELLLTEPDSLRRVVRALDSMLLSDISTQLIETHEAIPEFALTVATLRAERDWKASRAEQAALALDPMLEDLAAASARTLAIGVMIHKFSLADDQGEPLLAELEQRDSEDAHAWFEMLKIVAALESHEYDQARLLLQGYVPHSETTDFMFFARARAEIARGERSLAIDALMQSIAIEPRWLIARLLYIEVLTQTDNHAEALRQAFRTAQVFPDDPRVFLYLAQTTVNATESGVASTIDHQRAIDVLNMFEQQGLASAKILTLRARLMAALGRTDEAAEAIERILDDKLTPSPIEFAQLFSVARSLEIDGLQERVDQLGQNINSSPVVARARAIAAAQEGRRGEGEQLLRDALATSAEEDRSPYRLALADFLSFVGDPEEIDIRRSLAEENPESVEMQVAILDSNQSWVDQTLILEPLERIGTLLGKNSTLWRLYEARRVLTFDPTAQKASEVAQSLELILRRDPSNSKALTMLADAMIRLDDNAAAAGYLARAVDLNRNRPELYAPLIRLYQQTGQTDDAQRRLLEFANISEVSDVVRRQRVELLAFQAMWSETERDLIYLASAGAANDLQRLAQFYARRGKTEDASRIFDQLLADNPTPSIVQSAASFYASRGDIERGVQLIKELASILDELPSHLVVAAFYEQAEILDEAEMAYIDAAQSVASSAAWSELAMFYIRMQDIEKAQEAVNQGRASAGESDQLATIDKLIKGEGTIGDQAGADPAMRALLDVKQHAPAEGEEPGPYLADLREVATAHPTYIRAWQEVVNAYINRGRTDDAVDAARTAARANPADPRAARLAFETLAQAGLTTEAIGVGEQWRNLTLDRPFEADAHLARLLASTQRWREALSYLEPHRVRIGRDGGGALALYVAALASVDQFDDIITLMNDRSLSIESRAAGYLGGARGLLLEDPAVAREYLRSAPDFVLRGTPDLQLALAGFWLDLGSSTESSDAYAQAAAIAEPFADDPTLRPAAIAVLSVAYDKMNRFDQAEQLYREMLDADPKSLFALNNLAFLLIRTQAGSTEAADLARRGVEAARARNMSPAGLAAFLDTLGSAQAALGDFEAAEQSFREGLTLDATSPDLIAGLAQALLAQRGSREVDAEVSDLLVQLHSIVQAGDALPSIVREVDALQNAFDSGQSATP